MHSYFNYVGDSISPPTGQEKLSPNTLFENVHLYYEFDDKIIHKFALYLWLDVDFSKKAKRIYIEECNGKVFILENNIVTEYNNPIEFFMIKMISE